VATFLGTPSSANLRTAVTDETGSGSLVFANAPVLVAPDLGTPTFLVATNATGTAVGLIAGSAITNANLTGAVTSVGNATALGSFTSAQLITALTDETGSGSAVFSTSPTLVTPVLGTPQSGNFSTGTFTWPTFNQNTSGTAAGLSATLAIASGGTAATTAASAIENLLPAYAGNGSKALKLNSGATALEWVADGGGTVTSVAATVPSFLSIAGSPITTSGTLAFTLSGTALPTTSGGTGLTSFTSGGVVYASSSSALATGSALTFDGTNLGVGNAPAAWSLSGLSAVQVKDVSLAGFSNAMYLNNNVYYNGGWNFIGTGYGLQYTADRGAGTYAWNISTASGTAGNPITFTQVMTLDASGNLGIGTSSPSDILTLAGGASGSYGLTINNAKEGGGTKAIFQFDRDNQIAVLGGNTTNGLAFKTLTSGSLTTKATLDASGNLGLGVTPVNAYTGFSYKNFELAKGALFGFEVSSNRPILGLKNNVYFDASANTKYVGNGFATMYQMDSGTHAWSIAGDNTSGAGASLSFTQAMTLTAAGDLGIGTTSPAGRLHVLGSGGTRSITADTTGYAASLSRNTGGDFYVGINDSAGATFGSTAYSRVLWSDGAYPMVFATNSTERLRLDSAGNLGLGVTPSAWDGSFKAVQIAGGALGGNGANNTIVGSNAYYDAGWKYYGTASASLYQQVAGQHAWSVAGSGTAGNAISFTQAMTLDASSRLMLGTTSQAGMLTVVAIASTSYGTFDAPTSGYAYHEYKYNGTRYGLVGQANALVSGGSATDWCVNASNNLVLGTGSTERARIDSSGNLLVGTTSAVSGGGVLQVSNGITFPATQSASSNANTLDDYEEGTWTPSLPNGGTISINHAVYTKIGRQVTVSFYVEAIAPTNNSSEFLIGGLPFTIKNGDYYSGSFGFVGDTNLSNWLILGLSNSTTLGFRVTGNSAARLNSDYVTLAALGSLDALIINLTYFV
jgi:hypothetical protein